MKRVKSAAMETGTSAVLPCIRPAVVRGLEAITRAPTIADADYALSELFSACLPSLLARYTDVGLLVDYIDLERSVTVGLPIVLCMCLERLLADGTVASRLYPAHVRHHVRTVVGLLAGRLDSTLPSGILRDRASDDHTVPAVIWVEDAIREFAAGVLIGDPPPAPTTPCEREAARRRRLSNYVLILDKQGIKTNFSEVCRLAGVRRIGHGSGADWLNGKLPDSAKVCKAIELVISFQTPKK